VFEPLTETELLEIVDLMVGDVADRLEERHITLRLTDAAKAALVKEGYDPVYGARPLRRVIQRQVENPVSRRVLAGDFADGDTVLVDHTADGYVFTKAEAATAVA
jgi:ATP-dependent Clp protease ATP-binding subunit ClpA